MFGDERSEITGSDVANDAAIPKRRGRPPKVKLEESKMENVPVGVSMEEVFKLISKMDASRHEQMLAFAKELKKPTDREQKKMDDDDKRIEAHQKARIAQATSEQTRKEMAAKYCPHSTTHQGTGVVHHAWRAQVHTPHGEKPYFIPTCSICFTQAPKILATTEMLTNGVNLDQYKTIDFDRLKSWAVQAAA